MAKEASSELVNKQNVLDAFLVDNQELEALHARLAAFNMFGVLRIERQEIRHSNVLAWLLTPEETHGLGATFLRRFLSRLLMESDGADVSLTPAQVELMSFSDVEVLREWQNIDILVRSRSNEWCLLIENKVGTGESKGQLLKYVTIARREMPHAQIIPIYLTVEGEDPSDQGKQVGFVPWSHAQVLELTERIIEQHATRIPSDASVFLAHYVAMLRRITMQDEELIDLCKTIYRKHREAIELIVEYGASSQVLEVVEEQVSSMVEYEFAKQARGSLWFVPKEIGKRLPTVELTDWAWLPRQVAIACWCRYLKKQGKLAMILEVGPVTDGPTRVRLLKALQDAGFSFQQKGLLEGAKYTRIFSKYQKLRKNEDGDPDVDPDYIRSVTASLWEKLWTEGGKVVDVLKEFEWGKAV